MHSGEWEDAVVGDRDRHPEAAGVATLAVPVLGLLLVASGVAYWSGTDLATFDAAIASLPGALVAIAWAGVHSRDVDVGFGNRLAGWTASGGVALGGLILLVLLVQGQSLYDAFPLLQFLTGVGALAGVLIGANEIRSVKAAQDAERARLETEFVHRELDRLEFLNYLLRHHVLNKMNIVRGYAEVLQTETSDHDDELETVLRETADVVELVENVRVLVDSITRERSLAPVDLGAVLDRCAARYRDDAAVHLTVDVPDDLTVLADDLLRYAFDNLLENAVEHNDSPRPTVRVTAEAADGPVVVTVADDGPGLAPDRRDVVFQAETGDNNGLGLYLVRTLVTDYGGDVRVGGSDLGGAAFEVALDRADADDGATRPDEPMD